MRALVIDAYDSFVYIISQYLETLGVEIEVVRNDQVTAQDVLTADVDFVVLGPGPGHPGESGYVDIIRTAGSSKPMLGICLGHQAIGMAFGGEVRRADHLMHGKTSVIDHDGVGCFSGHAPRFHATRYHSLIVDAGSVPEALTVSATSVDDGYVMGFRHRDLAIESVQFHPESILTEQGLALFRNFILTHVGELEVSDAVGHDEVDDLD